MPDNPQHRQRGDGQCSGFKDDTLGVSNILLSTRKFCILQRVIFQVLRTKLRLCSSLPASNKMASVPIVTIAKPPIAQG